MEYKYIKHWQFYSCLHDVEDLGS